MVLERLLSGLVRLILGILFLVFAAIIWLGSPLFAVDLMEQEGINRKNLGFFFTAPGATVIGVFDAMRDGNTDMEKFLPRLIMACVSILYWVGLVFLLWSSFQPAPNAM